ncbi:MAG: hypothetical protein ACLSE6_02430 [Alphaproteobacteria bacterium]
MAEINFELYNNQLVQQLVGPQDANLKLIEQLLNVTIGSFGNQITIQETEKRWNRPAPPSTCSTTN